MQLKINKCLILENLIYIAPPSLVPTIQQHELKNDIGNATSQNQLNDIKKEYKGFHDYKTIDDPKHEIKRGAVYGLTAGAVIGATGLDKVLYDGARSLVDDDYQHADMEEYYKDREGSDIAKDASSYALAGSVISATGAGALYGARQLKSKALSEPNETVNDTMIRRENELKLLKENK